MEDQIATKVGFTSHKMEHLEEVQLG
jgi:hypothetical protein